ncbi:unnamed protein product, partial [Vitis vinifera]
MTPLTCHQAPTSSDLFPLNKLKSIVVNTQTPQLYLKASSHTESRATRARHTPKGKANKGTANYSHTEYERERERKKNQSSFSRVIWVVIGVVFLHWFQLPSLFPTYFCLSSLFFEKFRCGQRGLSAMVHDSILSPHRRSQTAFSSPSFRKQFQAREELGSCSTLIQRHRFLLTALVLLAFLCTIYLYFAVTLGSTRSCSGLTGSERTSCRLEHAKSTLSSGKLKFF